MSTPSDTARRPPDRRSCLRTSEEPRWPLWMRSWTFACAVGSGALALLWLLLRTGTKPSRLAYPCQQAAFGTAAVTFGVPFAAAIISLRGRLVAALRTVPGRILAGGLGALCIVMLAVASVDREYAGVLLTPPEEYHPDIYVVEDARGVRPGRYGGVDDLITLMGMEGLKWHRSAIIGPSSGPEGLIDQDDVVLIKINCQWSQRGGTNTDVLRGVMRQIVEHPDGFVGEIIVADNGQGWGSLDRTENNADDHHQSPQDVVNDFAAEGWNASTMLWDTIRSSDVDEYSAGDMSDGYVVDTAFDPETLIKVSYPKFQSASGTYVSYKEGIWSPTTETYDPDKLVVINIPVFKTHQIYAVTASVKNHMGVVTTGLSTDSHNAVGRGGMGSILAEVRLPDITILDCIWILARPGLGPSASYTNATRCDQLVAGTDPVALDAWATKFIMIPQIIENGYTYDDYHNTQDPDNPDSTFRRYLDSSMNELLLAGIDSTSDYNTVELHVWTYPERPDPLEPEEFRTGKNRFLSFVGTNPGEQTAIRVTFGNLPPPFDSLNWTTMWVGSPRLTCENAGQDSIPPGGCGPAPGLSSRTFTSATLVCEPHYMDWATQGTVHVHSEWIVPDGLYYLEAIKEGADIQVDLYYSVPLMVPTSIYGDIVDDCSAIPCGPPDGSVDIVTDVTAALDKFKNLTGAPIKARCDGEPHVPDLVINISDVTYVLDAFRGDPYPFTPGPDPCAP